MTSTLTAIRKAQQAWAVQNVEVDRGCTLSIEANLFRRRMHPETLEEFQRGAGDETGQASTGKKRAKMLSLRSSSVLAVNVFDFWRGRDLDRLATALGAEGRYTDLRFEQPFDHGLPTGQPHLDVVLYTNTQRGPFAIESKFAEPYDVAKKESSQPMAAKYFEDNRARWSNVGLPGCQALAGELGHRIAFRRLGAAQLLKHILGLANDRRGHTFQGRDLTLLYLWFDAGDTEADEHRQEIDAFRRRLDPGLDFRVLTYQTLFERLAVVAETDYIEYLRARYFPAMPSAESAESNR